MNDQLKQTLANHDAHAGHFLARDLADVEARVSAAEKRHETLRKRQDDEIEALQRRETVRRLLRERMPDLLANAPDGIAEEDILWGVVRYAIGSLACYDLDEPLDRKVRRLVRYFPHHDPIVF